MLTPALVIAAGVLAACGSGNSALPGGTSTSTSESSTTSDTWFTSVKSCEMLDESQLADLGFTGSGTVNENDSTQNSCEWDQSQYATIGVVLASSTYDSLPGLGVPVADITIAGRPGKIAQDSTGTCDVAIKATNGSRAQIIAVVIHGGGEKACSLAKQAAQDVAPKLPSLSG